MTKSFGKKIVFGTISFHKAGVSFVILMPLRLGDEICDRNHSGLDYLIKKIIEGKRNPPS